MVKRAALVLAGGKARRFQASQQQMWQDKALGLLENKPFLAHIIENIAGVVDEVIICVDDEKRRDRYQEILEKYHLNGKSVIDEKTEIGGPNRAILTGLKATQADFCLTVPCDMPFIKSNVVDYLFNLAEEFEVVMPIWPNGKLETLLMVLKRSTGQEILQTLCQLERSHVDDIPRAASKTLLPSPIKNIKNLDPELKSFININTKEDLKKMQTRNTQGSIKENIQLYKNDIQLTNLLRTKKPLEIPQNCNDAAVQKKFNACKKHFETYNNFFWTALACECIGSYSDAANNYGNEAKIYEKYQCTQLLKRALADKTRCESIAN
ncbi:MAG: molybdenum cofactor guanylyltransferase [Nitrososphaerota archaeon]|jgi:molybdopterin-guanine dinucleotide biosynthesis protein A|nr:molybdenum cofactor guanylyltransferase [Nitrososphaerota archaeon]